MQMKYTYLSLGNVNMVLNHIENHFQQIVKLLGNFIPLKVQCVIY